MAGLFPGSRLAKDHLPNRTSYCLFVLALVAFVFSFVAAIEGGEFLLGPPFWKRGSSHCPASVFAGANCACVYHVSYATLIVNFADWKQVYHSRAITQCTLYPNRQFASHSFETGKDCERDELNVAS